MSFMQTLLLWCCLASATDSTNDRSWRLSPTLAVTDVQPIMVGLQLRVPVVSWLDGTAAAEVGAGRGSQYLGGVFVGARSVGEQVWFGVDGGVALVQALTQGARGIGDLSLVAYETDLLSQLRGRVGLDVIDRLSVFVGITLNYQVSFGPNPMLAPSYFPVPITLTDPKQGGGHQLWPGVSAGVMF
jgi:hypothetical protein